MAMRVWRDVMECLQKTVNLDYVQTLVQRVECVLNPKFVVYIGLYPFIVCGDCGHYIYREM